MPVAASRTPLFRATTAVLGIGASETVDVRIDGISPKYVRVTPSLAPAGGTVHSLAINEATPVVDIPSATPVAVNVTDIPLNSANRIRTVIVTSAQTGTTFEVEAVL